MRDYVNEQYSRQSTKWRVYCSSIFPVYGTSPYAYIDQTFNETGGVTWRQILRILARSKVWITFALVVELVVALVFSMADTYEARATLEIEPPRPASCWL